MSHERKFFDYYGATGTSFGTGSTGWDTSVGISQAGSANAKLWLTSGVDNGLTGGQGLIQGTGAAQRIGSQITADQLTIRGRIIADGNMPINGLLRIVVFSDKECDGAYPSYDEVYKNADAIAPVPDYARYCQYLELGYAGRFSILMDKFLHIKPQQFWNGANAVTSGFDGELHFEWNKDLRDHKVNWDSTGASLIANARAGHIFALCYWVTQTISAGVITTGYLNPPQVQLMCRLRFRDTNSV